MPADDQPARRGNPPPHVYAGVKLIHNRQVVDELNSQGLQLASQVEDIPTGPVFLIRAHGVAAGHPLRTCRPRKLPDYQLYLPFVTKIH